MDIMDFQKKAVETDTVRWKCKNGPDVALLGIIGEMGSVAGVFKKRQRDGDAYSGFKEDLLEELGDLLWYIAVTAHRLGIALDFSLKTGSELSAFNLVCKIQNDINNLIGYEDLLPCLSSGKNGDIKGLRNIIEVIVTDINDIASLNGSDICSIAKQNASKTLSFFKGNTELPAHQFDGDCQPYEVLPRYFDIQFIEAGKGKSIMQMKGVNIGDKITDNSYIDDGYRFHDVFHLANVATLGWSPVLRRMLHRKRKSKPEIDEKEDGARAAIVEELVVNLIFNYADQNSFLKSTKNIDIGILKQIMKLVKGIEVEKLEAWEWKHCILEGCRVFLELRDSKSGGYVFVDSDKRSITFRQS